MPGFADLDAVAQRAIEGAFGETVRIDPRGGGQIGAATADPDRAARQVAAVFSAAPKVGNLFAGREAGRKPLTSADTATTKSTLTLSAATVATMGYLPRRNDRVVLIGRPGTPAFAVDLVDVDDGGAVTLFLSGEAAP